MKLAAVSSALLVCLIFRRGRAASIRDTAAQLRLPCWRMGWTNILRRALEAAHHLPQDSFDDSTGIGGDKLFEEETWPVSNLPKVISVKADGRKWEAETETLLRIVGSMCDRAPSPPPTREETTRAAPTFTSTPEQQEEDEAQEITSLSKLRLAFSPFCVAN